MIMINGVRYVIEEATDECVILGSPDKMLRITGPMKAMFLGGDIDVVIPGFIVEGLEYQRPATVELEYLKFQEDPHAPGCMCSNCIDKRGFIK